MGRIVTTVRITNLFDPERSLECDALVDTGAAYMVLPRAWKARLGDLRVIREIDCETATQQLIRAPVCGPVEIRVEGFEPVYGEVLFFDMEPADGIYEPLLGYIVLEQCQAAVDMLGLRLVHVKKTDLKAVTSQQCPGPSDPPEEQAIDLRQHDLWWMFSDAMGLFHLDRKYSCVLLFLCAVDALAKRAKADVDKVGERFRGLLAEKLPKYTRVQNFNIHVPQYGDFMRLEEILYTYLRNPMVHEGAKLDVDDPSGFAVCLDWSSKAPSVRISTEEKLVVLGGDWIVDCLAGVVKEVMAEGLTTSRG